MFLCQPREKFSLLCYGILSLPWPFENTSINYSDDPKLVARAHAIDDVIKMQHDLKSRMHGPSQEYKI